MVDELRKVYVSEGLFQRMGASQVVWGEPDKDGFYTPTVYRDTKQRVTALEAREAAWDAAFDRWLTTRHRL
jgi:hypothetical protein